MSHAETPAPHLSEAALHAWLDNALDPPSRAAAAAHLDTCAACAAQLAELQTVFGALDALPDAPLSRDLSVAVLKAIAPTPAQIPQRWRIAFAAQIAIALAAGGALALALNGGQPAPIVPALPALDPLAPLNTLGAAAAAFGAQQQAAAARVIDAAAQLLNTPLFSAGVCLSIAGVAWIVGNGALLGGARISHTGNKS